MNAVCNYCPFIFVTAFKMWGIGLLDFLWALELMYRDNRGRMRQGYNSRLFFCCLTQLCFTTPASCNRITKQIWRIYSITNSLTLTDMFIILFTQQYLNGRDRRHVASRLCGMGRWARALGILQRWRKKLSIKWVSSRLTWCGDWR